MMQIAGPTQDVGRIRKRASSADAQNVIRTMNSYLEATDKDSREGQTAWPWGASRSAGAPP